MTLKSLKVIAMTPFGGSRMIYLLLCYLKLQDLSVMDKKMESDRPENEGPL